MQPPSVADEIEGEQHRLASARARLDALQRAKPGWGPSSRRQFTEQLASTGAAIARHEDRLVALNAQQDAHDRFAAEHAAEFEQALVLGLATSARRLTVRMTAVADPPDAVLDLLGPHPIAQRDRLRWDHAVESVAVYLDEHGRNWPTGAATTAELLGPCPGGALERFGHQSVGKALDRVRYPGRDLGRSIGLG